MRRLQQADVDRKLAELAALKASSAVKPVAPEAKAAASLINTFHTKYDPKLTTEQREVPGLESPIPVSAEMNYYAPLKHEVKHGHLKAELVFKAYDPANVELFCDFALRAAYYLGLPATGATPIPTKRERWTVIRAPFVMAKTKENFERKTHGRIIKIWDSESEVIDVLLAYLKKNSFWGVGLKVNMFTQESVASGEKSPIKIGEESIISSAASSLAGIETNQQSAVAQKVLELLSDPVFTRHMEPSQQKKVSKASK